MPQTCSICKHEKHNEIDKQLLTGKPIRGIALRFGVTHGSLERHKKHIGKNVAVVAKHDKRLQLDAVQLSQEMTNVKARLAALEQKAMESGKFEVALGCIKEEGRIVTEFMKMGLEQMLAKMREGHGYEERPVSPAIQSLIDDLKGGGVESKYLDFVPIQSGKATEYWSVCNRKSGIELGIVKWHALWRQPCYFPSLQAVYSAGCLNDIVEFMRAAAVNKGGGKP